jgi:hypothetical protein
MSKKIADILSKASVGPEHQETLRTDAVVGRSFTIHDARTVETPYGVSWVGTIDLDGKMHECWLNGAVVARQMEAIMSHLPATVTLTRNDEKYGNPYELVAA